MKTYLIKSFSLRILHEEINKIIKNNTNVIRYNMDEVSIDEIIEECSYYSLLDEPKFVIVNNFKTIKDNDKIKNYFNNPNDDVTLILICEAFDKRSSIYKMINEKGTIILKEELKNSNIKIEEYCKEKGIKIDYLAITKLLDNNLNNYDLVLNEIDKISIVTNNITIDEVDKYSLKLITEENFDFCDVVIKKDLKEINKYLNDFISLKSEVIPFVGLLASQYRLIYAVKLLDGTNDLIAKSLGVHPYRVKLAKEKGLYYTVDELQKKLLDLCDLDYNLKSSNIDPYILLKVFLINV